jgi:hypothetical protein
MWPWLPPGISIALRESSAAAMSADPEEPWRVRPNFIRVLLQTSRVSPSASGPRDARGSGEVRKTSSLLVVAMHRVCVAEVSGRCETDPERHPAPAA